MGWCPTSPYSLTALGQGIALYVDCDTLLHADKITCALPNGKVYPVGKLFDYQHEGKDLQCLCPVDYKGGSIKCTAKDKDARVGKSHSEGISMPCL